MNKRKFVLLIVFVVALVSVGSSSLLAASPGDVFINEIHYDNSGTDIGEAIEVAGPASTDLTGWSIVLYNGSSSQLNVYDQISLNGTLPNQQGGFGTLSFFRAGIQNGAPDGLALVDDTATVMQFLSYEGSFTAIDGPAAGMTSTDIGVSESSGTAVGDSLQLTGSGSVYGDFTWATTQPNTFGVVNTGQSFGGGTSGPTDPRINEFSASTTGADVEYIEVFGDPGTDYSAFTVLEIEGDSSKGNIDRTYPVGTTDGSGFWTTTVGSLSIENGSITLLLVEDFTGSIGNDIDADDDGTIDFAPWTRIVDDVAVWDGGSSDLTYTSVTLGPNYDGISNFAPGGASRIPDGTDTNTIADWVRNDFDLFGIPGYSGSPLLGEAVNTPGATNEAISVPMDPVGVCGDAATFIHDIQGSELVSGDVGSIREVEAVVVATFQDVGQIGGYFVQEEDVTDVDADPLTSEGLRVFDTANTPNVGDVVRIRGSVTEFSGLTELNNVIGFAVCGSGVATPATVTLPVTSVDDLERYEGMAVTFPQTLVISEYFNFDRFGEIVLTSDRRLTPTAEFEPGLDAVQAAQEYLLSRITLDDGRSGQNPDPAIHPNSGVFDLTNLFRGGDTVANVTGVMDFAFGLYRIQPTQGADYTNTNPRTAAPEDVGGDVKVASFNVLNYFTTLDDSGQICGPAGDQGCRGADNATELTRQRDKIIAALTAIDADVVGLIEIENHPGDVPTADLVSGLNDVMGAGTYDYVATGAIGDDAIRVAFIYKPAAVSLAGDYAVLDTSVDARFLDDFNRPALAQSFVNNGNSGVFTVVVNHLKSKGSSCNSIGDPNLGDGAGNCNLTRKAAAEALVDWLATDPTGSGDSDFLIIGDLNSYDKEEPIDAILAGADDVLGSGDDYTDLLYNFIGEDAYSYVFDGQIGYLDHGLANDALLSQVTGTTVWHINADEADLIDYDTSFKKDAQDAIYAPDAYRSSDHDPVIIGLDVNGPPVCGAAAPSIGELWSVNHEMVGVNILGVIDPDGDPIVLTIDSIFQDEPVDVNGSGNTAPDGDGLGTATAFVRAERAGIGNGRVYHISFTATDSFGESCSGEVLVSVPKSQGNNGAAVDDGALFDSTLIP